MSDGSGDIKGSKTGLGIPNWFLELSGHEEPKVATKGLGKGAPSSEYQKEQPPRSSADGFLHSGLWKCESTVTDGVFPNQQLVLDAWDSLPWGIKSSSLGRQTEDKLQRSITTGDEKLFEEAKREVEILLLYYDYEVNIRQAAQQAVLEHFPSGFPADKINFEFFISIPDGLYDYEALSKSALVREFRALPSEKRAALSAILFALKSPGFTDDNLLENPLLSDGIPNTHAKYDELNRWVEGRRKAFKEAELEGFLEKVKKTEEKETQKDLLLNDSARERLELGSTIRQLTLLKQLGGVDISPEEAVQAKAFLASALIAHDNYLKGQESAKAEIEAAITSPAQDFANIFVSEAHAKTAYPSSDPYFYSSSERSESRSLENPVFSIYLERSRETSSKTKFHQTNRAIIHAALEKLAKDEELDSSILELAISFTKAEVKARLLGLAIQAGSAEVGGKLIDPVSEAESLDMNGDGSIVQKILKDIDLASLANGIDDSIKAVIEQERLISSMVGKNDVDKGWLNKRYQTLRENYTAARRLLDDGRTEDARISFLTVSNSPFAQSVNKEFSESLERSESIKFAGRIGIIVAAGVAMSLTVGAASPWLSTTFDLSTGQLAAANLLIGSGVFMGAEKVLSYAALNDLPYNPDAGTLENIGLLTIEYLETVGMFKFLGMGNKAYAQLVKSALFRRAEMQLVKEGAIKWGEKYTSEAARALLLQRAELGIVGKILNVGGAFGAEYVSFSAWDLILATGHYIAGDSSIDPTAVMSPEAMKERFIFLFCLKLAGVIAMPISKPLHEVTAEIMLKKYKPQLWELAEEQEGVLKRLSEYKNSGREDAAEVTAIFNELKMLAKKRERLQSALVQSGMATVDQLAFTRSALKDAEKIEPKLKLLKDLARLVTPKKTGEWEYKPENRDDIRDLIAKLITGHGATMTEERGVYKIKLSPKETLEIRPMAPEVNAERPDPKALAAPPLPDVERLSTEHFKIQKELTRVWAEITKIDTVAVRKRVLAEVEADGISVSERGREVFRRWMASAEIKQLDELEREQNELLSSLVEISNSATLALPTISRAELKPGHVYRGTLLRRVVFQSSPTGEINITNTGIGSKHEGFADFTSLEHPEDAFLYAKNGVNDDPVQDLNRTDAVIIEVPCDAVKQVARSDYDNPEHPYNFIPVDALDGLSGVKIYRLTGPQGSQSGTDAPAKKEPNLVEKLIITGGPVGITPWAGRKLPSWLKGALEWLGSGKKDKATENFEQVVNPTANVVRPPTGEVDLQQLLGVISSGLRADSSPDKRVGMDGYYDRLLADGAAGKTLQDKLTGRKVPVKEIDIDSDINQTDDKNRSVVEVAINALDASKGDVDVELKDGRFVVTDRGTGMTPEVIVTRLLLPKLSGKPNRSRQNGRFGIGFYTSLRHLKGDGDRVIVETRTEEKGGWRLTFTKRDGRHLLSSERMAEKGPQGTRVIVESSDIKKSEMNAEIERYLRYVSEDRSLNVNGKRVNAARLEELGRYRYNGEEGRLAINRKGEDGLIVVKAGNHVVEEFKTRGEPFPGEVVIDLPCSVLLSITRDEVGVNGELVNFLTSLVGDVKDLRYLGGMVEFFAELEKRSQSPVKLVRLLKDATMAIVKERQRSAPGTRVYADTPLLRERISGSPDIVLVHPELYHPGWLDAFERPKEFRGGTTIEESGLSRPVRVVLTDDIKNPFVFDKEVGVVYLSRSFYKESPSFALSALFMVPNLRFGVDWEMVQNAGVAEVFADQAKTGVEAVVGAKIEGGRVRAEFKKAPPVPEKLTGVFDFLDREGLLPMRGRNANVWDIFNILPKHMREDHIIEEVSKYGLVIRNDKTNFRGLISLDGRVLVKPEDYDSIDREDQFYYLQRNGRCQVYDAKREKLFDFPKGSEEIKNTFETKEGDTYYLTSRSIAMDGEGNRLFGGEKSFLGMVAGGKAYFCFIDKGWLNADGTKPVDTEGTVRKIIDDNGFTRFLVSDQNGGYSLLDDKGVVFSPSGGDFYPSGIGMDGKRLVETDDYLTSAYETGGEIYFIYRDSEGREKIYDGAGNLRFVTKYESLIPVYDNGQLYMIALTGTSGKEMLLDTNGNIIFQEKDISKIEHDGIVRYKSRSDDGITRIRDSSGRVLLATRGKLETLTAPGYLFFKTAFTLPDPRSNIGTLSDAFLYNADGVRIVPRGNDLGKVIYFDIREVGDGQYVIDATLPMNFHEFFDLEGRKLSKVSHLQPQLLIGPDGKTWAYIDAQLIPISRLEAVANGGLKERWGFVRSRGLSRSNHIHAAMNASETAWNTLSGDPARVHLLSQLRDPLKSEYVERHPSADPSSLEHAFGLIDTFGSTRGSDTETFLKKIDTILDSHLDIHDIIADIRAGRETADTEALRIYLKTPDATLLLNGTADLKGLDGEFKSLADVVTKIRLTKDAKLEDLRRVNRFGNEEEQRQIEHSIEHLHAVNPYAFITQLTQNALDVAEIPGRVTEAADRRVEVRTFRSNGRLVMGFRDYGGMTEAEFLGLLVPGEGNKRGGGDFLGGFGRGFYSVFANANWVRLKTAVKGAKSVIEAEFRVVRDAKGNIVDIEFAFDQLRNKTGFYGTEIETERRGAIPELETALVEARFKDTAQYLSQTKAVATYNGEEVNAGRNGALVTVEHPTLGRIELFDGLETRLLRGGLPLADLETGFMEKLPTVVKGLFARKGFYVNLDRRVKRAPTCDRLEDHEEVMKELEKVLPAMLIRGFLERVVDIHSAEDLASLPEIYFHDLYDMSSNMVIGRQVRTNAAAINDGRFSEFNADYYTGKDGEERLNKLLTLIRFITVDVDGKEAHLSLIELRELFFKATGQGDKAAMRIIEEVRKSEGVPASVKSRLWIGDGAKETRTHEKEALFGRYKAEQEYALEDVHDPDQKRYVSLLREVALMLWKPNDGRDVKAGIHTVESHLNAFALHYTAGKNYHIYRSFGSSLDGDAKMLAELAAEPNETVARERFEKYLAELYQVVSHELTHVLKEHPESMTHDPKFYADQMDFMTEKKIPPAEADRLFKMIRGETKPEEPPPPPLPPIAGGAPVGDEPGATKDSKSQLDNPKVIPNGSGDATADEAAGVGDDPFGQIACGLASSQVEKDGPFNLPIFGLDGDKVGGGVRQDDAEARYPKGKGPAHLSDGNGVRPPAPAKADTNPAELDAKLDAELRRVIARLDEIRGQMPKGDELLAPETRQEAVQRLNAVLAALDGFMRDSGLSDHFRLVLPRKSEQERKLAWVYQQVANVINNLSANGRFFIEADSSKRQRGEDILKEVADDYENKRRLEINTEPPVVQPEPMPELATDPLRIPRSKVKREEQRGEIVYETEGYKTLKGDRRFENSRPAIVISEGEAASYRVLVLDGEEFVEVRQPVMLRAVFNELLYNGKRYFNLSRHDSSSVEGIFHSDNRDSQDYVVLKNKEPVVVELPPDGTTLGVRDREPNTIIFKGRGYSLEGPIRAPDGWRYVRRIGSDNEFIRVRKNNESSGYETEAWPADSYRFPADRPIMVRDNEGLVWEIVSSSEDGRKIICRKPGVIWDRKLKSVAIYAVFEDTGAEVQRADLKTVFTGELKVRNYDQPEEVWRKLFAERSPQAALDREGVEVEVANLLTNPIPSEPRVLKYNQYIVNIDGQTILLQVRDFGTGKYHVTKGKEENIRNQILAILSSMPQPMLAGIRKITIVPPQIWSRARYVKGGHLVISFPWQNDGPFSLTAEVFHESGHRWTVDPSDEYRNRLMLAVGVAAQLDGKAGYRDYAERDWGEALAVGFEDFEKAGPHMQQLILNLLLNPEWQMPDNPTGAGMSSPFPPRSGRPERGQPGDESPPPGMGEGVRPPETDPSGGRAAGISGGYKERPDEADARAGGPLDSLGLNSGPGGAKVPVVGRGGRHGNGRIPGDPKGREFGAPSWKGYQETDIFMLLLNTDGRVLFGRNITYGELWGAINYSEQRSGQIQQVYADLIRRGILPPEIANVPVLILETKDGYSGLLIADDDPNMKVIVIDKNSLSSPDRLIQDPYFATMLAHEGSHAVNKAGSNMAPLEDETRANQAAEDVARLMGVTISPEAKQSNRALALLSSQSERVIGVFRRQDPGFFKRVDYSGVKVQEDGTIRVLLYDKGNSSNRHWVVVNVENGEINLPPIGNAEVRHKIEEIIRKGTQDWRAEKSDPKWTGKLVHETEESIYVEFEEENHFGKSYDIPKYRVFDNLREAVERMYEEYHQANARDEISVGVITLDGLPRYVVVHGGFAVFPVGRPVAHTHPEGATASIGGRGDTKEMSIGEHRYIYSVNEDAERLTTYTKLNDDDLFLIRFVTFKGGQTTEKSYIMTDDPNGARHYIPLEEALSLVSRARAGTTTAEVVVGEKAIKLTARVNEKGTIEGVDLQDDKGRTFKIPAGSITYLRPYDVPKSVSATSKSIKPPTDTEMAELERVLDIVYADPEVAKWVADNERNLYGKVEMLALARIDPAEMVGLLYNLWGNTIPIIRGATTVENADDYFRELDRDGDLNGPPQRTKTLLDAIDASPWLARAFGTKPHFEIDIEKVRAGYDLYEKYARPAMIKTSAPFR